MKRRYFTAHEDKVIRSMWLTASDEEIAAKLQESGIVRDAHSIATRRTRLGLRRVQRVPAAPQPAQQPTAKQPTAKQPNGGQRATTVAFLFADNTYEIITTTEENAKLVFTLLTTTK